MPSYFDRPILAHDSFAILVEFTRNVTHGVINHVEISVTKTLPISFKCYLRASTTIQLNSECCNQDHTAIATRLSSYQSQILHDARDEAYSCCV